MASRVPLLALLAETKTTPICQRQNRALQYLVLTATYASSCSMGLVALMILFNRYRLLQKSFLVCLLRRFVLDTT
jgi:hypothetical protein